MRDIRYEHTAAAALDTARALFKRVDDAIIALEWVLIHDSRAGLAMTPEGRTRLLVFDQLKSLGMPRMECVIEYQDNLVIVHDLEFS